MKTLPALPVKVFHRDAPANKVDIANCFCDAKGFRAVPFVHARGIIGLNVPKYLMRKGLIHWVRNGEVDTLELTEIGKAWLVEGLEKHLKKRPEDGARLLHRMPATAASKPASARRATGPAPAAAPTPRRILRRQRS